MFEITVGCKRVLSLYFRIIKAFRSVCENLRASAANNLRGESVVDCVANEITEKIIGAAFKVGNTLGVGFLEKVYEKALFHELSKAGVKVQEQVPLKVFYDDVVVGEYFVDLLVEDIVVELKSTKNIDDSHFAQCLNYLKATRLRLGLIINFGSSKVQVRRVMNGFSS